MEWEIGDTVLCIYNREKYTNLIEQPEEMVRIARICMQTLLPFCQMYVVDSQVFDSMANIPADDKIALRFFLNGDTWQHLSEDIDKKQEIFEEVMEWFIRKSHEKPDKYQDFILKRYDIHISFSENSRSPFKTNFEISALKMKMSQSLYDVIQKNLVDDGFPPDLFFLPPRIIKDKQK